MPSTARFAWHRDSVSELIGDNPESAIEEILTSCGISYRKTKRAERIPRFEVIAYIAGRGFGVRREDMKKKSRSWN